MVRRPERDALVTDRWDVVVVGAGPAGATTALLLARAGASVLLVDRARFPRDKACSEYLSPATTDILERLGGGVVDAVEGSAHAKLYGMKVVAPGGAVMCGRFQGGPRPYSFALPRTAFDTILVAAAARAGAHVSEATAVENLVWERGAVAGVVARSCNGHRVTCNARIVVGADGLRSVVARRLGLVRSSPPRRVAFSAHVADVAGIDGVGELHVGKHGYVGLGPIGGGVTTVALVVPLETVRTARSEGRDFRQSFFAELERFPGLAGRRARGSMLRCGARSWPPNASSPSSPPVRTRARSPPRCWRPTAARAVANSPASGCSSGSSAWAWAGPRSPTASYAAWRAGQTSRIFW